MENLSEAKRQFRRSFRDMLRRQDRNSTIRFIKSLEYKLLGIQLFIIIEPPGLVRQHAGRQTYQDVIRRYISNIISSYNHLLLK